jgi:hypothetical protein
MKRRIFIFIITSLFSVSIYAQPGAQAIVFTGKPDANGGLDIYAENKTATDISGSLGASSLTLCVLVPSSINPQPTVTISSPIAGQTFFPQIHTASGVTISGITYDIYSYNGNGTTSSVDFAPGVPVLIATYGFSTNPVITSSILLGLLPAAGPSGFDNFYIAPGGIDETDYANPFYSDIASDPGLHNSNGVNDATNNTLSYLAVQSVILPVQFTNFSVSKKEDNAIVNWAVANEGITTDHYVVERSLDDITFTDIATVAVKGNGSANTYAYSDDNISALNTAVIYYRVEEVDKNGNTVFTGIKAVSIAAGVEIKAYPNPTKGNVTLTITLQAAADLALSLVDASGKTVQQLQVAGAKGTNTKQLDLSGYASGSYLLKVNNGTDISTLPIVKQ